MTRRTVQGEADLIVAKHRNGPTRTITVSAQLHFARFFRYGAKCWSRPRLHTIIRVHQDFQPAAPGDGGWNE